jgi:hypothetical protein
MTLLRILRVFFFKQIADVAVVGTMCEQKAFTCEVMISRSVVRGQSSWFTICASVAWLIGRPLAIKTLAASADCGNRSSTRTRFNFSAMFRLPCRFKLPAGHRLLVSVLTGRD